MLENQIKYHLGDFTLQKELGSGSFGKVFSATHKITKEIFAAKISFDEISDESEETTKDISQEVDIISKFNHPGILKFIFFSPINFQGEPRPVIITDFMQNGSLDDLIQYRHANPASHKFDNTNKLIIIYGIASAMSYLHSHGVIHCDLKPENILLDDFLFPKIADFGLSKIGDIISQTVGNQKGTPIYMAPEIYEKNEYSRASDVYAFSLIVYELMTLKKPFKDANIFELIMKVPAGERPDITEDVPRCYEHLIRSCWQKDPLKRPTFEEIVTLLRNDKSFVSEIDANQAEFEKYVKYIDESNVSFDQERKTFYVETDKKFLKDRDCGISELIKNIDSKRGFFTIQEFMSLDEDLQKKVEDANGDMEKEFIIAWDLVEAADNFGRNTRVALKYLKYLIKNGFKEAATFYARMLIKGEAVPKNYKKAMKLVCRNLDDDDPVKYLMMGKIYKKEKEIEKAKECLKRSIALKNVEAMYEYFKLLFKKAKTEVEKKEALKYLNDSIQLGYAKSIFKYGMLLKKGEIKIYDSQKKALIYIEEAAEKGYPPAMYEVASRLLKEDMNAKEKEKAGEYLRKAALKGHTESICFYGDFLSEKQAYNEKAAKLFKKASDKGYANGSMKYGYMLSFIKADKEEPSKYMRIGIRSRDPESLILAGVLLFCDNNSIQRERDLYLSIQYLMLAAKKGNALAAGLLGHLFHISESDNTECLASFYFKQAVKDGCVEAMFMYSSFLLDPNSHFFDIQKGVEMCKLAIDKGNSDAMCLYASLLLDGSLVECNQEEAIKYYKMAIDKGDEDAMVAYANMILYFDEKEAVKYYKLAIAEESIEAMRQYAIFLHNKNPKVYNAEVVNLLKRCISGNDIESMKVYAKMLSKGEGVVVDLKTAEELYEQLISINKDDFDSYYLCAEVIDAELKELAKKGVFTAKMFSKYERAKELLRNYNTGKNTTSNLLQDFISYDTRYLEESLDRNLKDNVIKHAREGDGYSLFQYGRMLEKGYCFPKPNLFEAMKVYKESADKGVVEAMKAYALMNEGEFPNPAFFVNASVMNTFFLDAKEAMKYYKMAADLGDAESLYKYALLCENHGLNDLEEVKVKFQEAVAENRVNEIFKLAMPLMFDNIITKEECIKYIKLAIQAGNTDAMFIFAQMIENCYVDVDPSEDNAAKYFKMIIDIEDDPEAYMFLSKYCGEDEKIECLRKAVEKGYKPALLFLSNALGNRNANELDIEEAKMYLDMAVNSGDPQALAYWVESNKNLCFYTLEDTLKKAYLKSLVEKFEFVYDRSNTGCKKFNQSIYDEYLEQSLPLYEEASNRGSKDAMMRYAYLLKHYKNDPELAVEYYKMAAYEGSVEAMAMCGYIYLVGEGVEASETKSRGYLRQAHRRGTNNFFLGELIKYAYEEGIEKDDPDFDKEIIASKTSYFDIFEPLTDEETAEIQQNKKEILSEFFNLIPKIGNSIFQNADDPDVQFNLGITYYENKDTLRDINLSIYYFTLSANQNNPKSQFMLGKIYYENKFVPLDINKAIYYFTLAADQDYVQAQYILGIIYYFGDGVQKDIEKGINYIVIASINGNKQAKFANGFLFQEGKNVEKNIEEAINCYKEASRFSNQYANNNLGIIYKHGYESRRAIEYFDKAIRQKNDYLSMYNLAHIYVYDESISKGDINKAIELLIKSSKKFVDSAILLSLVLIKRSNFMIEKFRQEIYSRKCINSDLSDKMLHIVQTFKLCDKQAFESLYESYRNRDFVYDIGLNEILSFELEGKKKNDEPQKYLKLKDISSTFYEGFCRNLLC